MDKNQSPWLARIFAAAQLRQAAEQRTHLEQTQARLNSVEAELTQLQQAQARLKEVEA